MKKINLTVIIPLYNKEYSINIALNSIISQSVHPMKIIIIDDGSTDNSLNECKNFIRNNQSIFKKFLLISRENKGVSFTRNQALEYVDTKYVTFLDADDEFLAGYFEKRLKDIKLIKSDIYTGSHFLNEKKVINPFINNSGIISYPYFLSIFNSILNSSKVIFDLSNIDKNDLLFPIQAVKGEDLYLWLKLMNKYKIFYDIKPYVRINYVPDFSRQKRNLIFPYPIEQYNEFKNYSFSCKLYIHFILLKHLRKHLFDLIFIEHGNKVLKNFPYLKFLKYFLKLFSAKNIN